MKHNSKLLFKKQKIEKLNDIKKNIKLKKFKMEKMDIIYTYVNSDDNKWKNKFKRYVKNKVNNVRYKDYEEIYFSLKTLVLFSKNICNKVYIVTDNQKLDEEKLKKNISRKLDYEWLNEKITYIFHKDIIPKVFLPTFNSITIESFLHNIPNLTENFIYINDDMFFGNFLKLDYFFYKNTPNVLVRTIHKASNRSENKPWLDYYLNVYDLFKNEYKIFPNYAPMHTYYFMNKTICNYCWRIFNNELYNSITQIRNKKNINFWFLCFCMGIYKGYFNPKIPSLKESISITCHPNLTDNERIKDLELIFKNRPMFFCYNNITDQCEKYWDILRNNYLKNSKKNISIVSLNILAHKYTNFTKGNKNKRETDHEMRIRYIQMFKILKNINADIYCLQEVDQLANKYLSIKFKDIGYLSYYVYNDLDNGLLILWRMNFNSIKKFKKDITKKYNMDYTYPKKKQLAQFIELNINDVNFMVINTRLWGHPERIDVRIDELKNIINTKNVSKYSILCGDFNETDYKKIEEIVNKKYNIYKEYFKNVNFATSYHPWNINRNTQKMYKEPLNHKYKNVDYFLYSKSIKIIKFDCLPTKYGIYNIEEPYKDSNSKYDKKKWFSDHALLFFNIKLI